MASSPAAGSRQSSSPPPVANSSRPRGSQSTDRIVGEPDASGRPAPSLSAARCGRRSMAAPAGLSPAPHRRSLPPRPAEITVASPGKLDGQSACTGPACARTAWRSVRSHQSSTSPRTVPVRHSAPSLDQATHRSVDGGAARPHVPRRQRSSSGAAAAVDSQMKVSERTPAAANSSLPPAGRNARPNTRGAPVATRASSEASDCQSHSATICDGSSPHVASSAPDPSKARQATPSRWTPRSTASVSPVRVSQTSAAPADAAAPCPVAASSRLGWMATHSTSAEWDMQKRWERALGSSTTPTPAAGKTASPPAVQYAWPRASWLRSPYTHSSARPSDGGVSASSGAAQPDGACSSPQKGATPLDIAVTHPAALLAAAAALDPAGSRAGWISRASSASTSESSSASSSAAAAAPTASLAPAGPAPPYAHCSTQPSSPMDRSVASSLAQPSPTVPSACAPSTSRAGVRCDAHGYGWSEMPPSE
eukprot:scaffold11902_cov112-Isochrysis_galbana.AAC.2